MPYPLSLPRPALPLLSFASPIRPASFFPYPSLALLLSALHLPSSVHPACPFSIPYPHFISLPLSLPLPSPILASPSLRPSPGSSSPLVIGAAPSVMLKLCKLGTTFPVSAASSAVSSSLMQIPASWPHHVHQRTHGSGKHIHTYVHSYIHSGLQLYFFLFPRSVRISYSCRFLFRLDFLLCCS